MEGEAAAETTKTRVTWYVKLLGQSLQVLVVAQVVRWLISEVVVVVGSRVLFLQCLVGYCVSSCIGEEWYVKVRVTGMMWWW